MKKLTKDIVIEVRELFNKGYSASEILSELNLSVAKSTLYSIKQNKSWMDL
jgi:orotate phosphoribosyltransferase-like protein